MRAAKADFASEAAAIHKHIAAGEQEFGLAARELVSVRDRMRHGQWLPWLKGNGISPDKAQRIIREHGHPEKGDDRRAKNRERNTAHVRHLDDNVVAFPDADDPGDDEETVWRRGILNRADEAAQLAAYDEGWRDHPIDQALVDAAEQAAQAWGKLAAFLRRNRK